MTSSPSAQHAVATNVSFEMAAPIPDLIQGGRRRGPGRQREINRRSTTASLIGFLAARYPVTRQMIGEDSFAAIARSYAMQFPPISRAFPGYGACMPAFIRNLGRAPSIEYLADIAELESARACAVHAPHQPPVALAAFSRCLTIDLHPSASLVASRFPVVSIWENQMRNDSTPPQWRPEAALVLRPERDVQVWRLPPGGHAFLTAIMLGQHLSAATRSAMEQHASFDIDATVEILIAANACVGYRNAPR